MTGNEKILQYLSAVPAWYLATSVDDQPHVRPFSFAAEQDGKIWFCTATSLIRNSRQRPGGRGMAGLSSAVARGLRTRSTTTSATPASRI